MGSGNQGKMDTVIKNARVVTPTHEYTANLGIRDEKFAAIVGTDTELEGDKVIERTQERRAVFLPETLSVTGSGKSSLLHRSIFDVNVYTADLAIEGSFGVPDIADVDPNAISVRWRDALFVLGLSDVSGLKEAAMLSVNGGEKVAFAPSVGLPGIYMSGMHAKLSGAPSVIEGEAPPKAFNFRAGLVFSGLSPDRNLVEFVELPRDVHPFYVGTQAHPELRSRPNDAHPLFRGLVGAALERQQASLLFDVANG